MNSEKITSERLLLREPGASEVDAVHAACQDSEILRWLSVPSPYERRHASEFVERIVPDCRRADTMYTFGIFPRTQPVLLGMAGLTRRPTAWEIGYWAVREYRGRGYVTEAVGALARWAFTALRAERVEWRAEVGNDASRAVALRAGFVMEGTLRSATRQRDVLRDVWVGSLLPSDIGRPAPYPYLPSRER